MTNLIAYAVVYGVMAAVVAVMPFFVAWCVDQDFAEKDGDA